MHTGSKTYNNSNKHDHDRVYARHDVYVPYGRFRVRKDI